MPNLYEKEKGNEKNFNLKKGKICIIQIIAPSPINKTKKIEQAQSFGRKGFMFFLVFKPCELSKFVYLHARVIYIIKIAKPFRP